MKRLAPLALAFGLAGLLVRPALAQSDETCIAYMEADAAHDAAERQVHAEWNAARQPAFGAYKATKKVLDGSLVVEGEILR